MSVKNGKLTLISMGQGQEGPAEAVLDKYTKEGGWVFLDNVHLMQVGRSHACTRLRQRARRGACVQHVCRQAVHPPPNSTGHRGTQPSKHAHPPYPTWLCLAHTMTEPHAFTHIHTRMRTGTQGTHALTHACACAAPQGWIPRLERKLEIAAESAHPDFRCFFSAEPINGAPHAKIIPESILQTCIKVRVPALRRACSD